MADNSLISESESLAAAEENERAVTRAREKEPARLARVPNAVLAQTWSNDDLELAKATLIESLSATKRFFDKDAKGYVEVPDHMARITAANSICNQALGLPVQRILRQNVPFRDRETEFLDMAKTPSGRAMLLRMGAIDEAWLANHAADLQEDNR